VRKNPAIVLGTCCILAAAGAIFLLLAWLGGWTAAPCGRSHHQPYWLALLLRLPVAVFLAALALLLGRKFADGRSRTTESRISESIGKAVLCVVVAVLAAFILVEGLALWCPPTVQY